jgi:hypothetical protein
VRRHRRRRRAAQAMSSRVVATLTIIAIATFVFLAVPWVVSG